MQRVDFDKFRINLNKARTAKGLTAKELSEAAGLRQQKRISDIEDGRGNPSLDEVISICHILEQPVDQMLNCECRITIKWDSIWAPLHSVLHS